MPKFVVGTPVESTVAAVEVTIDAQTTLPIGKHKFQLVVVDDSENQSLPDSVEVVVKDLTNPTALLRAPTQVDFGKSFTLDGRASSDVPPGKVVKWIFTLMG
jgi:hypothetical protein